MLIAAQLERARRFPLAAVAVFSFLSGCDYHTATSRRIPVRMAVGGETELTYLSTALAQELGYYDDEGLSVELNDFQGGQKSVELLMDGSTDVVCGYYDRTVEMAAKGQPLRAFVSMLRYPGLVAVGAAPGIARIEDLKGRSVGVSSTGSVTQMFLNYLLVTHGLKPEDVNISSIGLSGNAIGAVTQGKVDAAIMTDPALATVRRQSPRLRILADTRTANGVRATFGVDSYPSVVLYSTTQWLTAHPDRAERLARALNRTTEWMRTHPADQIRQRMPPQFRTENAETDLEGLTSMQAMLSKDGKLTPESAETVRKVLSVSLSDVRTARIDLEKTYTNEFIK
jgi:NitT/TauT family transport system substrate-binding protein